MPDEVHHTYDPTYRVTYKRESTKGVDGFTVEATGSDIEKVKTEALALYTEAKQNTEPPMV